MSVVIWVGLGITAWLVIAVAVAVPIGKYLHRARHRQGSVDPLGCPAWCVRERAAALLRNQLGAQGGR